MSPLAAATLVFVPATFVIATLVWRAMRSRSPRSTIARTGISRRRRERNENELEFFHPADLLQLRAPTPDCEGMFPLARDVHGNLYVVDPRQPDPAVVKIDPRASERQVVSPRLSEFLRR